MNVISVEDLTKVYQTGMKKGGVTALNGATLSVRQGEIFGLLGPNGAGKTTLFKVLLGITSITDGEASINGLPVHKPESRKKVGYLPENHRFPDHLTGYGLLELAGRMFGMSIKEIDECADRLLELVGMSRWGTMKIRKYSKGMAQRIGIAQALVCDPDILLLDEPTDGVDPIGKSEIKEVMKKIRSEGKSIFLNSHLLSEVETLADRVAILSKGKVLRVGTIDDLTSRHSQYEVEAEFGDMFLDIPEEIGKKLALSSRTLLVELKEEVFINDIIDELRVRKVRIKAVRPIRISLEQSFMETIAEKSEQE